MSNVQWWGNELDKNGVFTKVWVTNHETPQTFMGPFPTEAAAKQAVSKVLGTQTLTGWQAGIAELGAAGGFATGGSGGVAAGLNAGESVGNFFHGLNLGEWILRIGEIVLGVVLVGVGIAHITGVQNTISKAAKVAGTAALL